ncbi:hypothetical protein F511_42376 [Dorcoceras hygrometricum]|uniref:DUF4219 domain-containing protein n=1 Tax=Dorcoceras hygrometricum TaxID=472368 RepID=A0A2Z7A9C6_9LAMI|nr:hypothetical protein F511_42376 [Dorcoceras hygrometricum]
MSTSHNKIPMFSKEDYDDWKIIMQAHLAAQDDDLWSVITDGPMTIMKINIVFATTDGAPEYVEKRRHEYTNEEKKKANLDNVARDILVGSMWFEKQLQEFRKGGLNELLEGSTRRFDGYRPSANTQSLSLAQGELLATPTTKQSQLLNTRE